MKEKVDLSIIISELLVLLFLSYFGFKLLELLIRGYREVFLKANFVGCDLNKKDKPKVVEAQGVLAGCVFLVIMYIFLPVPFFSFIKKNVIPKALVPLFEFIPALEEKTFLFNDLCCYLAGLQSVCCMILLGFADDALNLKWKHKLILPSLASLPLLMVHLAFSGTTTIIVPVPFKHVVGSSIDIGIFYYVYMGMLAVFSTNAINILAGVNGLEVGQSLIISISLIIFNTVELFGTNLAYHRFSLFFMIPFTVLSLKLFNHNRFPAKIFVGDTYCYFAGMTLAVVGILGHFSKTLMLFFIPQTINFILSMPQLFKIIPCPRHRMPKLDESTGLLNASTVVVEKDELKMCGKLCLSAGRILRMVVSENKQQIELVNFTVINLCLKWLGPCKENILTDKLLGFQILCSLLGFVIRYPVAWCFFDS